MLSQPGQGPIFIIVDGLDECPSSPGPQSARGKVLELIKELVGLDLPDVHLCVASRPEIDIQKEFESLNALQISLHDEAGQEADIIAYIKSLVNANNAPDWTEEDEILVINTLTHKANGMLVEVIWYLILSAHVVTGLDGWPVRLTMCFPVIQTISRVC